MKAFMTACAVLASSANADSQVFTSLVNPGLISPYNVMPLSQGGYTNAVGYSMTQPLTPVTHPLTTYGMGPVNMYGMVPAYGHNFVKREANQETPYVIQTRIDSPIDGSKQEVQIKVDKFGKGKSFQHVEQQDEGNAMRDNYMLEHRRMAQRPLVSNLYMSEQRGMNRNTQMGMGQMQRNHMGMNPMYTAQGQGPMDLVENVGTVYHEEKKQSVQDILNSLNGSGQRETISNLEKVIAKAHKLWETGYGNFQAKAESLRDAKKNNDEMRQNLKKAFETHNDLGGFLQDAIKLIKSAKEEDKYIFSKNNKRYRNYLMNNNQMIGYNMRENQMFYPQSQMIHAQRMRI